MNKTLLLTGASGFIGGHAIPKLLERGYQVYGLTSQTTKHSKDSNLRWIKSNLFDYQEIKSVIEEIRPSHLLHLAWVTEPGKFWNSIENGHWVEASLNLVRHFVLNGGRRLVVSGTCAEYDWEQGVCNERQTPLNPKSFYGSCKRALHLILESYALLSGISFAWGRIFYLFGPSEHPNRLLPAIVSSLLEKKSALLTHGTQKRDFLYVKDVADAFATLLDSALQGAINIASGRAIPRKEIAQTVGQALGCEELLKFGALSTSPLEPVEIVADTERLSSELGWLPKYPLNQAIEETIQWWKQQR